MTRRAIRLPADPIAAQEISFDLTAARCRGRWRLWGRAEAAHQQAPSEEERSQAAAPALALCHGCPETVGCRLRAQYDHYTGLAAGAAWINGVSYEPSKVHHVTPIATSPGGSGGSGDTEGAGGSEAHASPAEGRSDLRWTG